MLKIRLRRMGSRHRPFYRVVVSDSRRTPKAPALEEVGYYDPRKTPATRSIDVERVDYWMSHGARPSDTVQQLVETARRQPAAETETTGGDAEAEAAAETAGDEDATEKAAAAETAGAEGAAQEAGAESAAAETAVAEPAAEDAEAAGDEPGGDQTESAPESA